MEPVISGIGMAVGVGIAWEPGCVGTGTLIGAFGRAKGSGTMPLPAPSLWASTRLDMLAALNPKVRIRAGFFIRRLAKKTYTPIGFSH
ncbi:hypothetical protein GCM10010924_31100 [Rhizobium wenxiniae]|nr:hypothetical protein GCM10010924_31100 [Rhizobium wenxiniae]